MNEEEKEDNYWKGYIEKQKEAEEICKMCKYRKRYKELKRKEAILDKVTEKLKENIKKEREIMPYLPHKSASFHYANGKEVLAKEILEFIEGEKK